MDQPFVYKILEKDNLFLLLAILIFISAVTQLFNDAKIATDHFLVGLIFLIGSFAIKSFKETDEEVNRIEKKLPFF